MTTQHTRSAHATPASPASVQRLLVSLLLVGGAAVAVGLLSTIGARSEFRPLVPKAGWSVTGQFPRFPIPASPLEVPTDALAVDDLVLWRSWNPETQGTQGTVTSAPFMAPAYLAVPHLGFPGEVPGNRVFLRCSANGAEMEVARLRTNTGWATAFIKMPSTFCAAPVVLVATAAGHPQFYVGVGTPFAISGATYRAQVGFASRAFVVLLTWVVAACLMLCAAVVGARHSSVDALPMGFVALGSVAMLLFTVFHFSPTLGRSAACLAVAAAACIILLTRARAPRTLEAVCSQLAGPMVLWLSVALTLAAFASSADSGGGSWAINGLFTPLRWSSDNQLPYLFAEALFDGTPRHLITWGPWLASDRTPLLAALLLIPRTTIIGWLAAWQGSTFIPTAYMMAGITILTSWVAVVAWICRRCAHVRASSIVLVAITSPFVFFDSLYTWPKLLGASFALLSFGLLYRMSSRTRQPPVALAAVAACASLSYLSHASNAFALIPIAVGFAPVIWRQGGFAVASSVTLAATLLSPWMIWQGTVQPGGTALLRLALANDPGFDKRTTSVWASMLDAYGALGVRGWIAAKVNALALMLGVNATADAFGQVARNSPGMNWLGSQRVLDFFVTSRALGVAAVGLAILPARAFMGVSSDQSHFAVRAALTGAAGLVLMLASTLPRAFMHHQPFGSLMLLIVAGATTIGTLRPGTLRVLFVLALTYFLSVWIVHPLAVAERLHWTGLVGCAHGLLLVVVAGRWCDTWRRTA